MAEIIGVTFKAGGKVYYFAPREKDDYKRGEGVVVETARGIEYATVSQGRTEVEDEKLSLPLKPVLRKATQKDEETHKRNIERRSDALRTVREAIERHGLDMKLLDCEFAFDGSKAVFYYSSPQRVDFRELVKEISSIFRMRIELRQVGIRDEIKLMGGIAPCGRECCCAGCMPNIKKVTIKMAKTQGLSLNPVKISGLCGRLMCCLGYENDYYAEACKNVPKMGSEVGTPDGKGIVVNVDMLKMTVRVKIEDKQKDMVTFKDFEVKDVKFRRPAKEKEDGEEASEEQTPEAEKPVKEVAEKPREERKEGHGGGKRRSKHRPNGKKPKNNQSN